MAPECWSANFFLSATSDLINHCTVAYLYFSYPILPQPYKNVSYQYFLRPAP